MVADEENRASRFQQVLKIKIQMFLEPQQFKTYSQVLTIACEVEWGLEKKRRDKIQKMSVKRSFRLMDGEDLVRPIGTPLAICPLQPSP